jgi:hypothetical protein
MALARFADRGKRAGHVLQRSGKDGDRQVPKLDIKASFDETMQRYPGTMARLAE